MPIFPLRFYHSSLVDVLFKNQAASNKAARARQALLEHYGNIGHVLHGRSALAGVAVEGGIRFGPTANGKTYISLYAHRRPQPHKSRWHGDISPESEYALFERADLADWTDPRGHYWSFASCDGTIMMGTEQQRLAKHPRVSNPSDDWHGYPVSPKQTGDTDAPADELIKRWEEAKIVTRTFARRIRDRRV